MSQRLTFSDGPRQFRLELVRRSLVLWCGDQIITGLDQQALRILVELVVNAKEQPKRQQRLVPHERLCRVAWRNEVKKVAMDVLRIRLHTEIKQLRAHLGDNRRTPTMIGSVRPHGYRFLLDDVVVDGPQRTAGSLGAASSVFLQQGLLSRVVGTVMKTHENIINLNLDGIGSIEEQVRFVQTEEMAEISGRLNAQAFRGQLWRGTGSEAPLNVREKSLRNRGHCQKNPFALLLIKSFKLPGFTPLEQYIGFSHVLPLNARGYSRYCSGSIEDNKFDDPKDICGLEENVRALALFSIAVDTQTMKRLYKGMPRALYSSGEFKYQVGLTLVKSIAYHVQRMMEHYDSDGSAPVELLAQNDGAADIINVLEIAGFEKTQYTSGDRFPIWRALCKRSSSDLPLREFREVTWFGTKP